VIQFFGYFFYETMYNTFRIGIVCEYIDHKLNLEYVFRKRKQVSALWKQEEVERMIVSLISTLSHMQSVGLCHRDLKPANLFLLPNGEIKVIDFGESKDYFREDQDGGDPATATIRGTPQYLSPILWKAHVVDGNSRFAKHNIYKSDVFSVGLMFYQLTSMEDVTGLNQKTPEFDGEKLIEAGIKRLK
jgi:serine/threonine-protein kinase